MKLEALFAHDQTLPPVPRVVQAVLAHTAQDATHDKELAALIAADPVICARLLQVANSARYQRPQQISSVQQAMQLLGQVNVRTLVLSLGLISGFRQLPPELLQPLWRHSLYTAALSRPAAPLVGVDAELAYTLGLLQCIGQLLMHAAQAPVMQALDEQVSPLAPERLALERQTLGYGYTDVSAELARRWQFPERLAQALQASGGAPAAGLPDAVARLAALTRVSAWQAWAATLAPLTPELLASWPTDAAEHLGLPRPDEHLCIASLEALCPALPELLG